MKKFETPVVEVVTFAAEDVIATSTPEETTLPGCGTILPDDEL